MYGSGLFTTTGRRWGETAVKVATACRFWRPGGPSSSAPLKWWTASRTPLLRCSRSEWIVPDERCLAGLVKDGRHVNAKGAIPRTSPDRTSNVEVVQRFNPVLSINHVTLPHAFDLVASAIITRRAEIYLYYG